MFDIAFPLYFNWVEIMEKWLSPEQMVRLISVISEYYRTGEASLDDFEGAVGGMAELMIEQIRFAQEKKEKGTAAGKRGGRPRKTGDPEDPEDEEGDEGEDEDEDEDEDEKPTLSKTKPTLSKSKPTLLKTKPTLSKTKPTLSKSKPNTNTNKNKNKNTKDVSEKKRTRDPPTLREVYDYVGENYINIDPNEFWQYYESVGWTDPSGRPIVDWRARLEAWVHRHMEKTGEPYHHFNGVEDMLGYVEKEKRRMREKNDEENG